MQQLQQLLFSLRFACTAVYGLYQDKLQIIYANIRV